MSARHPDFSEIQARLRRINPAFYPPGTALDDEYGPAMARGIDGALDELEASHGLTPWRIVPPPKKAPQIPARYAFLLDEPAAPLMVRLALKELGLVEKPGSGSNPTIVGWADEVEAATSTPYTRWAADWYSDDSVPWCGLFMAVIAVRAAQGRAERMPPDKYLAALSWANWGISVPVAHAAVGDVMVLGRQGGGHVTLNVGTEEGGARFFGLGANQSDAVNILPFPIERVRAVRRPPYLSVPAGARRVYLKAGGASSVREG